MQLGQELPLSQHRKLRPPSSGDGQLGSWLSDAVLLHLPRMPFCEVIPSWSNYSPKILLSVPTYQALRLIGRHQINISHGGHLWEECQVKVIASETGDCCLIFSRKTTKPTGITGCSVRQGRDRKEKGLSSKKQLSPCQPKCKKPCFYCDKMWSQYRVCLITSKE